MELKLVCFSIYAFIASSFLFAVILCKCPAANTIKDPFTDLSGCNVPHSAAVSLVCRRKEWDLRVPSRLEAHQRVPHPSKKHRKHLQWNPGLTSSTLFVHVSTLCSGSQTTRLKVSTKTWLRRIDRNMAQNFDCYAILNSIFNPCCRQKYEFWSMLSLKNLIYSPCFCRKIQTLIHVFVKKFKFWYMFLSKNSKIWSMLFSKNSIFDPCCRQSLDDVRHNQHYVSMLSSAPTLTIHAQRLFTLGVTSKFWNIMSRKRRTWIVNDELVKQGYHLST